MNNSILEACMSDVLFLGLTVLFLLLSLGLINALDGLREEKS
jgi:hypothetical protein